MGQIFYRGYDVYDPVNVGFISQGTKAEAVGSRHDVSVPGNSNQGHLFGTDLTEPDKSALLSYLKHLQLVVKNPTTRLDRDTIDILRGFMIIHS